MAALPSGSTLIVSSAGRSYYYFNTADELQIYVTGVAPDTAELVKVLPVGTASLLSTTSDFVFFAATSTSAESQVINGTTYTYTKYDSRLLRSDGTAAGTVSLAEVIYGSPLTPGAGGIRVLATNAGVTYFTTSSSTVETASVGGTPHTYDSFDVKIYAIASSSTTAQFLADLVTGSPLGGSGGVTYLAAAGGRTLFSATAASLATGTFNGFPASYTAYDAKLYASDGTSGGTIVLSEVQYGSASGNSSGGFFVVGSSNGRVLYTASSYSEPAGSITKLYVSDTALGGATLLVDDVIGTPRYLLTSTTGKMLFTAISGATLRVYSTDSSTTATETLLSVPSNGRAFSAMNYPAGKAILKLSGSGSGASQWLTDGTSANTVQSHDFEWSDGPDGSWTNAGNWHDTALLPTVAGSLAPTATDTVTVNRSGVTISGTGSAFYLKLLGTIDFSGTVTAADLAIGSAAVTVQSGATLTSTDNAAIGSFGSAQVTVQSGGTLQSNVIPAASATLLAASIGATTMSGGSKVIVAGPGASWELNGRLAVGGSASGALEIRDGGVVRTTVAPQTTSNNGTITLSSGSILFSVSDAATGTGIVQGAGSQLDSGAGPMFIGDIGPGTLTVSDGGAVSSASPANGFSAAQIGLNGGNGTLRITDPGSIFRSVGQMNVGGASGTGSSIINTGQLFIENGGTLLSGFSTIDPRGGFSVGDQAGGTGHVTVDGAGSHLDNNGRFDVGRSGIGAMTVQNQALVTTDLSTEAMAAGLTYAILVGVNTGSTGYLAVTGANSTLSTPKNMAIGLGGTGTLAVADGGTVSVGTGINIGNAVSSASHGMITVDGSGSTLIGGGDLAIGTITGSIVSTGTLSVTNGGLVTIGGTLTSLAGAAGITIDASSAIEVGGQGHAIPGAIVIDANGLLAAGGDIAADIYDNGSMVAHGVANTGRVVVGFDAFGSLRIGKGATLNTAAGTPAVIADQSGSDGAFATVSGPGSAWRVSGQLVVGSAAYGSLAISAGGTVTASDLDTGKLSGGVGGVSVVGAGSALTLTGALEVGGAGTGELSILNGATVSAASADFGLDATGTANVDIEGAGSHLKIAGDLNIGITGVGVLTLGADTELTIGKNLNIGAQGVLNSFGGVIDPERLTVQSGGQFSVLKTTTTEYTVGVFNSGTVSVANGAFTLITPMITSNGADETGVLSIKNKGTLVVNAGTVDPTQSVFFSDKTGVLSIGTLAGFNATIENFITGDDIIVQGTSIASVSFDSETHLLTLFDGGSATIGALQFGEFVNGKNLVPDGAGGIGTAPCFLAGTRIATERGEVAVEDLRVGERVQVVLGGQQSEPVVWLGHRTVDCTRHPEPHKVWPVRVAAGAFGPGRPCRDLWLSPDHAVYIGDVLIPVKCLINGGSIAQVAKDEVTYYHVELPRHAVLLAEGLAAESYLDVGDRSNFANGEGAVALYPDFASRAWEAAGCAPLVVTGPALQAARRWVAGVRKGVTGARDDALHARP